MPTYEEVMQALRNADAAGDTQAATRLAEIANSMIPQQPKQEEGVTLAQVPGLAARSAIQGVMALPNLVADPLVGLVNRATGLEFGIPSQALKQGLTQIGLPEYPKTELGRIAEAGAEAVSGAGSQLQLARQIAEKAISPITRLVGQEAAKQPAAQLAVAAPAATVSQATLEATGSPLAALAAGGATGAAGGLRRTKLEEIPTSEMLAQQAKQQYQRATEAGVIVKPETVQSLSQRMFSAAKEAGFDPDLHPGIAAVLRRIEREGANPKSIEELETLRRVVRAPGGDFTNPDQQRIAGILTSKFDEAVNQIGPNDIIAGDSKAALEALGSARKLYARNKKSDLIDDLVKKAELSSTQYSQSGMENALRVQFRALAKNKTKMAQFSADEQDQIRRIVKGEPVQNVLRFVGKFAPTGVVSALPTGIAGAVSPYLAPVVPLVSFPARKAAESMGMANIDMLTNMIRLGRRPEVTQGRFQAVPQTGMRGLLSSQQE
jgi:polyhydroxyalkanoate synthesis regulator phasin